MIKKSTTLLFLFVVLTFSSFAQSKPIQVYISQKVWFAKHLPLKHSFEPFKTETLVKGTYIFTFYKDHLIIKSIKSTSYKILFTEKFKDEVKYHLEDEHHLNFVLEIIADSNSLKNKEADIQLMEYAKDNSPLTVRMIMCKKL